MEASTTPANNNLETHAEPAATDRQRQAVMVRVRMARQLRSKDTTVARQVVRDLSSKCTTDPPASSHTTTMVLARMGDIRPTRSIKRGVRDRAEVSAQV
jgi:hypothetical protein